MRTMPFNVGRRNRSKHRVLGAKTAGLRTNAVRTFVLGLTGGIATGKSTLAKRLPQVLSPRLRGLVHHDADKCVHQLMAPGGLAYRKILARFGDVTVGGEGSAIDRQRLGKRVFGDPEARRALEAILHPLVYRQTRQTLARAVRQGRSIVVLDVPLLFETGGWARCNAILNIEVSQGQQRARALHRPGMTDQKLKGILAAQASATHRRKAAHIRVQSGAGVALSVRQARRGLATLRQKASRTAKRYRWQQLGSRGVRPWPPRSRRSGFWHR